MTKVQCRVKVCRERQTLQICIHHMRLLTPELTSRLMKAYRGMKAGRREGLTIFNNTLNACIAHIEIELLNNPERKPEQAQGNLL